MPYVICLRKASPSTEAALTDATLSDPSGSGSVPPPSPGTAAAAVTPAAKPAATAAGGSFAERAFHPEEIRESGGTLVVDVEYYLGQQV